MSESEEKSGSDPSVDRVVHTPGPWFAGELRGPDGEQTVSVGPSEKAEHFEDSICECWQGNHNATENARLIAAAPDMLAALKAIVSSLDALGSLGSNLTARKIAANEILDTTGEAPIKPLDAGDLQHHETF